MEEIKSAIFAFPQHKRLEPLTYFTQKFPTIANQIKIIQTIGNLLFVTSLLSISVWLGKRISHSLLRKDTKRRRMENELVKCECCGLKEECTQAYITQVKAKFDGKWLCGLCSEAVRDEVCKGKKPFGTEEAVRAHMSFCGNFKSNPAVGVSDGMRQMLRRRSDISSSSSPSSSSSKKYSRSSSTSQVGDSSSFSLF